MSALLKSRSVWLASFAAWLFFGLLRSEAAASGDLGWSIGHGTFTIKDGANVQRSYSKYLTVWIHTPEGWRWLMDGGNNRPAPTPVTP